jgi:hypothetical protein
MSACAVLASFDVAGRATRLTQPPSCWRDRGGDRWQDKSGDRPARGSAGTDNLVRVWRASSRRFPAGSPPAAENAPWRRRPGDGECDDRRTDRTRRTPRHGGPKGHLLASLLAQVEANEHDLRPRRDELEAHLIAAPAVNWAEAAGEGALCPRALRGHPGADNDGRSNNARPDSAS